MGAEPYWYYVKYESDINNALQKLKQQEFMAGRYNPVIDFLDFPIVANSPSPGAKHSSIQEAFNASEADGTRSILDIEKIAEKPDFCVATPLVDDIVEKIYGTKKPTREMIEKNMDFFEQVERGHCIYLILYKEGKPDEILFAGYSFD
ncbi:MAG TPA: hypothetical protein VHY08_14840 [Bacillota bacterium]|nr:hypothetical protein [Bacillota bacterium]